MNSYELSRAFFDYAFNNPEKIKPNHVAIYFFAIEHCNRLGWKEKFGFPSQMVMEAVGIKNWRTYSKTLSELVEFGFIKMVEISKNQYSSNIIAIVKNTKANTKALDKALQKHGTKHGTKQGQSIDSIDKQYNNITKNKEQENKSAFAPPALSDVISYFTENGYSKSAAQKAFDYYSAGNWKDSKGNQVKNWKQKMQGVWFKDEHKAPTVNGIRKRSPGLTMY